LRLEKFAESFFQIEAGDPDEPVTGVLRVLLELISQFAEEGRLGGEAQRRFAELGGGGPVL